MPRKPKPYKHQGWYVTEAGGKHTKLCPVSHGEERAAELLAAFLRGEPFDWKPKATLGEVFTTFLRHAETYYRLPSGEQSSEVRSFKFSWKELLHLHGDIPADQLRRIHVQSARDRMVAAGISRKVVNQSIGRIKRAVRWMVEAGHIPDECYSSLTVLRSLAPHRSPAPERSPVLPVDVAAVRLTWTVLGEPWKSILSLQWYSGMRPGEACGLTVEQVLECNTDSALIDYGTSHKMAYKGRQRKIVLGPQAIFTLIPWLYRASIHNRNPVFWCRQRDTPVLVSSYAHAVERAAQLANVSHWHPNQVRHSYLTRVRKVFGLDAAQVAAGHAKADVTQVYAEADVTLFSKVAARLG